MAEKVIRNPSLEDIEKLKMQTAVPSKTKEELESEEKEKNKAKMQKPPANKNDTLLKQKRSAFEPESVKMKLPSLNVVVKDGLTLNNEIFVRRMTLREEQLLVDTAQTTNVNNIDYKKFNVSLDAILDNCVSSNISIFDLSLIDKFAILAKIIDITYGKIKVPVVCLECGTEYVIDVSIYEDYEIKYLPKNIEYPKTIKLKSYPFDLKWTFHYPTINETNALFDIQLADGMILITDSITGTFQDIDGKEKEVEEKDYVEILTNLKTEDRNEYQRYIDDFGKYGISMNREFSFCTTNGCLLKGKPQNVEFPMEEIFTTILSQAVIPKTKLT